MPDHQPFAIQAAKASWIAPLLACGLAFFGRVALNSNPPLDPETQRLAWPIIGGISVLIVLAGLILGIVALFGIGKRGWKGILIPSLIGILLCSGYLFLLINAVLVVRQLVQEQNFG